MTGVGFSSGRGSSSILGFLANTSKDLWFKWVVIERLALASLIQARMMKVFVALASSMWTRIVEVGFAVIASSVQVSFSEVCFLLVLSTF